MRSAVALVFLLTILPLPAAAQSTTAGEMRFQQGGTIPFGGLMFVDDSRPVTADGTITNVSVRWLTDVACSDEIRITFLHPSTFSGFAGDLQIIGTAGPFPARNGLNLLSFPGIAVKEGDRLAVSQLRDGCGGVTF